MKENRLAILALQETHLDEPLIHSINKCFGKRITVIYSQLPANPCLSARVAFVINKALIVARDMEKVELIEGRAMAIKFKWHENNDIILINVYPPNEKEDHHNFWEQVDSRRRAKGLRCPDMLLGDFNVTEDAIDRAPAHMDNINAIAALRNLRQCLGVKDTWRHTFPDERAFSFRASCRGQQIMSRLDRIYMSDVAGKVSRFDIARTTHHHVYEVSEFRTLTIRL
ncbi:Endonuclease/exonuclease/phosphatase [Lactarius quietus]|nr:Endonuclease/exonuclease/phosphatase [Lactarius quietus]